MKTKKLIERNKKLTEANKKLRKRLQHFKDVIWWCMDQDWSYGNCGPAGVITALWKAREKKI